MVKANFFDSVLFVIVLYKRSLTEVPAYHSLQSLPASGKLSLYIYDNGPDPQQIAGSEVIYHHDGTNSGVSRAYNNALAVAQRLGKKWLLLLDQDTEIAPQAVSSYGQAVAEYPSHQIFTLEMRDGDRLISPYRQVFGKGRSVHNVSRGPLSLSHFNIINSGMLIHTSLFSKAGGYDEDFPLDFSDVSFCDRLKKVVDSFVVADGIGIHRLSAGDPATDIGESRARFVVYAEAAKKYKQKYNSAISIFYLIFSRAVRLFFRFRNPSFLMIGWQKCFQLK